MTSNHTSTAPVDTLLRFGVYASSYYSEYSQIPMYEVIANLIRGQRNRTYNLTRDLEPAMEATGSKGDPTAGLVLLESYFKTAPHNDCASTGKVLAVAAAVATLVFMIARFAVRKWVIRCGINKADWTMLLAWVATLAYLGAMFLNTTSNGACRHVYDISYNDLRQILIYTFAIEVLYCVASCAVKLAFLVFYWDLNPRVVVHRIIIAVAVLCMIVAGVAMLAVVIQCNPLDSSNQNTGANAKCLGKEKMLLIMGIATIVTDFLVLFLGIPVVWRLYMRLAEKFIVTGIFALGAMVCGAACARVITNHTFVSDPDATYKQGTSGVWGTLELCLAILISCVAAMGGLFSDPSYGKRGGEKGSESPQSWSRRGDMEMVGQQRMRSMDSEGVQEVMRPIRPNAGPGKIEGRYYMKKDGWSEGDFEVGFAK